MQACKDCPRRSIEPNCHNADTCEAWAAHMAEREKVYAQRTLDNDASLPPSSYKKHGRQGGQYVRGIERPRVPRGRTVISGR